jgi:hypothetical protein
LPEIDLSSYSTEPADYLQAEVSHSGFRISIMYCDRFAALDPNSCETLRNEFF